jgi:hypothetical protein
MVNQHNGYIRESAIYQAKSLEGEVLLSTTRRFAKQRLSLSVEEEITIVRINDTRGKADHQQTPIKDWPYRALRFNSDHCQCNGSSDKHHYGELVK